MGFKCPTCKKDFGIDKNAFREHIENCGNGEAKSIVGIYTSKNEAEAAINIKIYAKKLEERYRG